MKNFDQQNCCKIPALEEIKFPNIENKEVRTSPIEMLRENEK